MRGEGRGLRSQRRVPGDAAVPVRLSQSKRAGQTGICGGIFKRSCGCEIRSEDAKFVSSILTATPTFENPTRTLEWSWAPSSRPTVGPSRCCMSISSKNLGTHHVGAADNVCAQARFIYTTIPTHPKISHTDGPFHLGFMTVRRLGWSDLADCADCADCHELASSSKAALCSALLRSKSLQRSFISTPVRFARQSRDADRS